MQTETMHAVQIHIAGGPDVLRYEEVARPIPQKDEVLIQVHAAGINPADLEVRSGFASLPEAMRPPLRYPLTLGYDVSGIVVAIGDKVTLWKPGDEVFGLLRFPPMPPKGGGKAYAEYTVAPEDQLARKPQRLSHARAAAVPMVALTAWQMFEQVPVSSKTTVLVNGAGGGVGHMAVQIAKLHDARVIGAGSARHAVLLHELGVDAFIDYTKQNIADAVHNVDLLVQVSRIAESQKLLPLIRRGGIFFPAAPLGVPLGVGLDEDLLSRGIVRKGLQVHSSGEQLGKVANLIDAGKLHIACDRSFPLSEAAAAHAYVEAGHLNGKVVLQVI